MAGNDQQYEWLAPWEPVDDGDTSLVSELIREVSTAHFLWLPELQCGAGVPHGLSVTTKSAEK